MSEHGSKVFPSFVIEFFFCFSPFSVVLNNDDDDKNKYKKSGNLVLVCCNSRKKLKQIKYMREKTETKRIHNKLCKINELVISLANVHIHSMENY